MFSKDI
jgi:magnesium-transporting ATPase (P-type)